MRVRAIQKELILRKGVAENTPQNQFAFRSRSRGFSATRLLKRSSFLFVNFTSLRRGRTVGVQVRDVRERERVVLVVARVRGLVQLVDDGDEHAVALLHAWIDGWNLSLS